MPAAAKIVLVGVNAVDGGKCCEGGSDGGGVIVAGGVFTGEAEALGLSGGVVAMYEEKAA